MGDLQQIVYANFWPSTDLLALVVAFYPSIAPYQLVQDPEKVWKDWDASPIRTDALKDTKVLQTDVKHSLRHDMDYTDLRVRFRCTDFAPRHLHQRLHLPRSLLAHSHPHHILQGFCREYIVYSQRGQSSAQKYEKRFKFVEMILEIPYLLVSFRAICVSQSAASNMIGASI